MLQQQWREVRIVKKIAPPVGIRTKQIRKKKKFAQTPGSAKSIFHPKGHHKLYCKRNRSYKRRDYEYIMRAVGKGRGGM